MSPLSSLGPEAAPREKTDEKLAAAGWIVQDRLLVNLGAGRLALATENGDCVFASCLTRFRFKTSYRSDFLRCSFQCPRSQTETGVKVHGGANQNVHAEDIKRESVPIADLATRKRIVDHLDALQAKVDELKRLQAETQKELDALMPSILDRAFKGEL
ncbi:hypothetical protein FJY68_05685 [candidate division WOR-3 bacterium]|uniref:Type I restriction modification DNA specificity domain-containing protein n=1 Tax=candidate division WOR-3 bacterium TaxID=2052148 RepID=A0A938BPN1_UNCW3|nr:hypothetical protein [candidate division WOR-3 bacterium]